MTNIFKLGLLCLILAGLGCLKQRPLSLNPKTTIKTTGFGPLWAPEATGPRVATGDSRLKRMWPSMGTFLRVEIRGLSEPYALAAAKAAHEVVDRYDQLMSLYKPESELSGLNREGGHRCVHVSAETQKMIDMALQIARETQGAFDPTVGPFSKGRYEKVQKAGSGCYFFSIPDLRIDLGGIAKGGALDEALEVIKQFGASAAYVDLGGNGGVFGGSKGNNRWFFEIAVPQRQKKLFPLLRLDQGFISTSNQKENPGHILDPESGRPVEGDLDSVTVISENGARGDALSTALFVMGAKKAKNYLEKHSEISACLVMTSGKSVSPEEDRLFCRPFGAQNGGEFLWIGQ